MAGASLAATRSPATPSPALGGGGGGGGGGDAAVPNAVLHRAVLALAQHAAARRTASSAAHLASEVGLANERSSIAARAAGSSGSSGGSSSGSSGGGGGGGGGGGSSISSTAAAAGAGAGAAQSQKLPHMFQARASSDTGDGDDHLISRLVREDRSLPKGLAASLLSASEGGRLPRVCAALHLLGGRPALALISCLEDPSTYRYEATRLAMDAILSLASAGKWSVPAMAARRALRETILERLGALDALDRPGTVELLRVAFDGEHEWLFPRLNTTPLLALSYLATLLPREQVPRSLLLPCLACKCSPRRSHACAQVPRSLLPRSLLSPPSSMRSHEISAADLPNKERSGAHAPATALLPSLVSPGSEPIGTFHLSAPAPATASALAPLEEVPGWMHDAFVSLLCAQAPREVRSFLEASDGYRLELALQATQAHGCEEGAAYLLERTGDVRGSMRLMSLDCH